MTFDIFCRIPPGKLGRNLPCDGEDGTMTLTPRTTVLAALMATSCLAAATALSATASTPTASTPTASTALAAAGQLSSVPSWAHGRPAAVAAATDRVSFAVLLRLRDSAELSALARRVSDPDSASYRHFLTTAQLNAQYAPTAASVSAVTGWLQQAGVTVDGASPSGTMVLAHASARTVESALQVRLARFAVGSELLRAPLSEPTVPASLRAVVAGVQGLAQSTMKVPSAIHQATRSPLPSPPQSPVDTAPGAAFYNTRPCTSAYGTQTATEQPGYLGSQQPYAVCGYTAGQVRSAYGIDKTPYTGRGQTVAIIDAFASPTIEADTNTWSGLHDVQPLRPGQLSQVDYPGATQTPQDPTGLLLDPQGWAGEETLDVQAVHGLAPDADIVYVAAATPESVALDAALAEVVEGGLAQIVSNSYGQADDAPDASDKFAFDQVTTEAAAKGIGVYFSSGDDGDEVEAAGTRTADYPATSDLVTAVGGTTLEIDSAGNSRGETYWGTRKAAQVGSGWALDKTVLSGAGGGGVSTSYAEPTWQQGVVPASLATYGGVPAGRVVPDISMVADSTTGFLVGQTQTQHDGTASYSEYRIGGTSLSCPLFAALMALADQASGQPHGDVAPALYKHRSGGALRDPSATPVVGPLTTLANVRPDLTDPTDTTSAVTYSLRLLGNLSTLHALSGYDYSTWLGTPNAPALLAALR